MLARFGSALLRRPNKKDMVCLKPNSGSRFSRGFLSLFEAAQSMVGLKLAPRKVMVEQLAIDRLERTPTED